MAFMLALVNAYSQAPVLEPGYETYIYTPEGYWKTLGTDVTGSQPITIEWRKDGIVIPGQNDSFLQIEWVRRIDAGTYTLTATNAYGTVTSEPIVLEVAPNQPPVAELRAPMRGSTFTPGTELTFGGYGTDRENGRSVRHDWSIYYHENGTVSPGPEIADIGSTGDGETSGIYRIPPDLVPSPGAFYRIYFTVTDYDGATDTDSVDVVWSGELNTNAPEIDQHPQSQTVPQYSTVTFAVVSKFAASYQWTFNGSNIPGATESTYQIESVQPDDEGVYRVLAFNSAGIVESNEAVLTVIANTPPTITDQPDDVLLIEGAATFSVKANLAAAYQWQLNGADVPGATSASYRIDFVKPEHVGTYKVIVSNAFGSVESEEAQLILTKPIIKAHPKSITVPLDDQAYFVVRADYARTYQWKFNGANIPGATGPEYTILNVDAGDAGRYSVVVMNQWGETESTEAVLTVSGVPGTIVMKTNPANLSVFVNEEVKQTRYAFTGAPGTQVDVMPNTQQTKEGVTYAFSNWAHGGPPSQSIVVPDGTSYYTINYSAPLTGRWRTTEVGAVNIEGSASYGNGTYTLSGAGNDIWSINDAFRFVYQSYTGDVDIRARVTGLTNTHPWAKAGVMIRNSNDPKAMNVMMLISAANGASFQNRYRHGEITAATVAPATAPSWVRIVRSGNTFTGYVSSDGEEWTQVGTPIERSMNERVFVGLAVTSHNTNALATGTFTDVSVSAPEALVRNASLTIENQFDVYPNPVDGNTLYLKLGNASATRKLEVLDVFGKVLLNNEVGLESDVEVDIQTLPPGVYVVRLTDGKRVETKSLIKK
jgi:hypothetical protein